MVIVFILFLSFSIPGHEKNQAAEELRVEIYYLKRFRVRVGDRHIGLVGRGLLFLLFFFCFFHFEKNPLRTGKGGRGVP
jgi:hypothetical protein